MGMGWGRWLLMEQYSMTYNYIVHASTIEHQHNNVVAMNKWFSATSTLWFFTRNSNQFLDIPFNGALALEKPLQPTPAQCARFAISVSDVIYAMVGINQTFELPGICMLKIFDRFMQMSKYFRPIIPLEPAVFTKNKYTVKISAKSLFRLSAVRLIYSDTFRFRFVRCRQIRSKVIPFCQIIYRRWVYGEWGVGHGIKHTHKYQHR